MASNFLHATDLGSDTDDDDYVPDTGEVQGLSEEEQDGSGSDDGGTGQKVKKKKKRKGAKERGIFSLKETDKETESIKEEFEKEKQILKEEEEKKKMDDLWADFKKETGDKPKPKKPAGNGLGSLLGIASTKPSNSKQKGSSAASSGLSKPRSILSSIFDDDDNEHKNSEKSSVEYNKTEQEANSKVKITQVFDFAGENVSVTKEVDKDSKEAKKLQDSSEKAQQGQKRPGGIASVMDVISGKKKKMGCLDKSKLDWNEFVEKEGIKEELQTFNKGKDGYVEKQAFLERSDLRRFELEREAREKTRKTFNR